VIAKHKLTADDILYRMKKRLNDPPLGFKAFKEVMLKVDPQFSTTILKDLFDILSPKK